MEGNKLLPGTSRFFVGCNYWASHAGTAMWSDWRPDVVEQDLKKLADEGLEILRVFPLWPDFQPIHQMYAEFGKEVGLRFGETRLPDTDMGRAGVSEEAMKRFGEFVSIAGKYGIKLIVGLITGWMSGRLFVPPGLQGRDILTDKVSIQWQVRFVKCFVQTFKHAEPIVAWDLGNECNSMQTNMSREDAWVWTSSLTHAIKAADPGRPIISGMHCLAPTGAWTMQDQGELTDILTTHPYPYWTPLADYDPINTMRPLLHATAESLFYGHIGSKPCFAEEIGTMGPMVSNESIAADFARASLFSLWAHGCHGLLWWCSFDQLHLNHPPYDWIAAEGELGLMTEAGRAKPALKELGRLKRVIHDLPLPGELPPRITDAVCVLGSAQDHWAVAYGSFLLAKQAGLEIEFQFEDQPLKESGLYLVPCITGCKGIPKPLWQCLLEKVREGAHLYLSVDDGYILQLEQATGLSVRGRSRRSGETSLTLTGQDQEITLGGSFKLELEALSAEVEVLGTESDGNMVFTRAAYGQGMVYFFSLPLETNLIRRPEVCRQPDLSPYWRVYEVLGQDARKNRAIRSNHPQAGITEHPLDDQSRVAVCINYTPHPLEIPVELHEGWSIDSCWYGHTFDQESKTLTLAANDAAILVMGKQS